MKLFTTGFLQVFFVVINTYFISKGYLLELLFAGLLSRLYGAITLKK